MVPPATFKLFTAVLALGFSSATSAAPASDTERDLAARSSGTFYPIISPDADTTWTVGRTATFVWNASTVPPDSTQTSWVDLYHSPIGSAWEVANLAQGFLLTDGSVSFVVPDVAPGDYFVMFNAWANSSPHFQIVAP